MLSRRIKKLSSSEAIRSTGLKYLMCSTCDQEEVRVAMDISKVTCARCVQKLVAPPDVATEKSDKPRGWHFKVYFEHNGSVYSKGKLITDAGEIKKLKKKATLIADKKFTNVPSTSKRGRKNANTSE